MSEALHVSLMIEEFIPLDKELLVIAMDLFNLNMVHKSPCIKEITNSKDED